MKDIEALLDLQSKQERPSPDSRHEKKTVERCIGVPFHHDPEEARKWLRTAATQKTHAEDILTSKSAPSSKHLWEADIDDEHYAIDEPIVNSRGVSAPPRAQEVRRGTGWFHINKNEVNSSKK